MAAGRDHEDAGRAVAEARRRLAAGDAQGAFRALRACAVEHPAYAPAYLEASRLLLARGDRGGATQILSDAMGRVDDEGRAEVAQALAALLAGIRVTGWHPRLEADLLSCLEEPSADAQVLARVTADLVLAKHPDAGGIDLEALADDALILAFLSRCLNVQPAIEAWIAAVRRRLAARVVADGMVSEGRRGLVCALALQAFASEYLAEAGADEVEAVGRLRSAGDEVGVALVEGLSQPLIAIEASPESVEEIAAAGGGLGALLVKRTLDDLRTERRLAAAMPTLVPAPEARDAVSEAVQEQYEANPYPRWLTPPVVDGRRLADALADLPGVGEPPAVRRILIAGCGTGYEAIDMARMEPGLAITALDLSRASLAYGRRMADELGVANVDFRQGNILDLEGMGPAFDLVTCTGVLHHMADTAAGLSALKSVLKPGGLIRLALYSERARAPVMAAHSIIAAEGLAPTVDGVRALRRIVLAAPPNSPLEGLASSDDFHSVSGCRDLVFHVHERRFTLPEVAELLAGQGLQLVGFDTPPEVMTAFQNAFGSTSDPLDLTLWARLEQDRPFLFAAMYPLWCRAVV